MCAAAMIAGSLCCLPDLTLCDSPQHGRNVSIGRKTMLTDVLDDLAPVSVVNGRRAARSWERAMSMVSVLALHQENRIYIIEEKNWRIILYYLEFAQINANYMNLHFLLNQKGPRKF